MRVSDLAFPFSLKACRNRSCHLNWFHDRLFGLDSAVTIHGSLPRVFAPAGGDVFNHVPCRALVFCIQVPAAYVLARFCSALEGMAAATICVLNGWVGFEKCVCRGFPSLAHTFW